MAGILCEQALCWWSYRSSLKFCFFFMNLVGPVISALKKKFNKTIQTVKDVFTNVLKNIWFKKKKKG